MYGAITLETLSIDYFCGLKITIHPRAKKKLSFPEIKDLMLAGKMQW